MADKKFQVVLIEEGLGNFGDAFYYTRAALLSAEKKRLFEGAKCYADHPTKFEETVQPERSVRAIIGYFGNVHVEDGDAGQALLVGDLTLLESETWAIDKVTKAVGFSDQFGREFVGLSINASGRSEKIMLAEFLKQATIPESALPKLRTAVDKGLDEIEVCDEFTEAVSCDLVTEAGARGRVLKMLEGARLTMAKRKAPKNTRRKRESEDGAGGAPGAADGDHADAAQDTELVKSLIKKYVPDANVDDKEEHAAMRQALKHAQAAGYEGEAAHEVAGHAMQVMHQAAQESEGEAEDEAEDESESHESEDESEAECEDEAEDEAESEDEDDDGDDDGDGAAPAAPGKKQEKKSMERALTQQAARIARLEQELAKTRSEKLIEQLVRESKFPARVAKAFRESVKGAKSEKAIRSRLKIFTEAYGLGSDGDPAFVAPEKGGNHSGGGFSLADCKVRD